MTDEERAAMLSGGIAELEPAIERALAVVRAEEREACAIVVDEWCVNHGVPVTRDIAAAIRARGNQ